MVYCDPPYRGTTGYAGQSFDHEAFYSWLLSRDFPVFVSEYSMPDGFVCLSSFRRCDNFSSTAAPPRTERLFVQARFADRFPPAGRC